MARIPYPDAATQSDEMRERLARLGSLNVTRMMSHSEGALRAYARMGTFLLGKGTLDPVVREIVILRIGQLCGCEYEWHQHVSVARAIGMTEEALDAISEGAFDRLTEPQQIAARLAEEIFHDRGGSEATMARAGDVFSEVELIELVLTAGYYMMTAGFLLSFGIEIEDTPPLGASIGRS
jgi:AhpD family alkylhydroperoxidase